jgi:hypothetical protein
LRYIPEKKWHGQKNIGRKDFVTYTQADWTSGGHLHLLMQETRRRSSMDLVKVGVP